MGRGGRRLSRSFPSKRTVDGLTVPGMTTIAYDAECALEVAGGNKQPPTLNSEEPIMLDTVRPKSGAAATVRILDRRAVVDHRSGTPHLFVVSVPRQRTSGSVK